MSLPVVYTVVGARPQFIKAAPVSRALRERGVRQILVHTGQHYDENMSDVFFAELEIPKPDLHLGIGSASHGAQTGRMLEALDRSIGETKPDWVLVYGDTNSTLAGALAAAKLHVPVAHVEAGLRSFNRRMPEEINRVVTDHLADLLFAPTDAAVKCLADEGISGDKVRRVGDVMFDVALFYAAKAEATSRILERLRLEPKRYVLATVHRAENTDDPRVLHAIFDGLADVAREIPVVVPLHPRTRHLLANDGSLESLGRGLHIIDPVGYLDVVMLEKNAALIATDSGGMQKEAFFHGVPCATLRSETEWVELVDAGWNALVPLASADAIAGALRERLTARPPAAGALYGDGRASEKIVEALLG